MIDKRIGMRIKECRERRKLTQDNLSEAVGLTTGYISSIERGEKFPRIDRLIAILNVLEASANDIFIDVLDNAHEVQASELSMRLAELPPKEQRRILTVVSAMIEDVEQNN